jgi:hypothetical protein
VEALWKQERPVVHPCMHAGNWKAASPSSPSRRGTTRGTAHLSAHLGGATASQTRQPSHRPAASGDKEMLERHAAWGLTGAIYLRAHRRPSVPTESTDAATGPSTSIEDREDFREVMLSD